jgi:hypothetical protein
MKIIIIIISLYNKIYVIKNNSMLQHKTFLDSYYHGRLRRAVSVFHPGYIGALNTEDAELYRIFPSYKYNNEYTANCS